MAGDNKKQFAWKDQKAYEKQPGQPNKVPNPASDKGLIHHHDIKRHDYMTPVHREKHIPQDDYCRLQDRFMMEHQIQNLVQLKAYIKGQLGAPVICVEISDGQLEDIIRDTVQYIWRYYYIKYRSNYNKWI